MDEHPAGDPDDRECLRRLADGAVDALEPLYRRHSAAAFRHALWVLGRTEDAEDVVQAAFVRLAGLGADLLGIRRLPAYLGAIVHREAVALARRNAARRGDVAVDGEALLAASLDPADEFERKDLGRRIALLSAEQREALVLRIWGEFSFREIGRMTGVPMFTAASRYRLAIGRLRSGLESEGGRS
jgi:RNA polymerase sigma-70 factor (ECF subfamily)